MLVLRHNGGELYDERTGRFIVSKPVTIRLEHSLISISKWESKWHKPFLDTSVKSLDEELDYIRCMSIDGDLDDMVLNSLSASDFEAIRAYVGDPMTATTFKKDTQRGKKEVITSEIIYYWMVSLEIPFECEKWHLNRLLTLIKVCNIKNSPSKKMKKRDQLAQQRALNASRRARSGSKG